MTEITEDDLKKHGIAICLIKMAMSPDEFEKWYAEEASRWDMRNQAEKNGIQ